MKAILCVVLVLVAVGCSASPMLIFVDWSSSAEDGGTTQIVETRIPSSLIQPAEGRITIKAGVGGTTSTGSIGGNLTISAGSLAGSAGATLSEKE